MEANAGDHIVIESPKVGGGRKSGEVVEVLEGFGGRHYRVHWDDGHDTILYPSADAFVTSGGGSQSGN